MAELPPRAEELAPEASTPSGVATPWLKAFGTLFTARTLASAAAVLCTILAARYLGPESFSRLAVLLAVMKVAGEIIGPALDTGLVRFGARAVTVHNGREDIDPAIPYFRAMGAVKLAMGLVVLVGGVLASRPLAGLLLPAANGSAATSGGTLALIVAFFGGALALQYSYVQAVFQARRQFGWYGMLDALNAWLRLAFVAALILLGWATPTSLLAAFVVAQLLLFGAACWKLPRAILTRRTPIKPPLIAIVEFTRWIIVACAFTTLGQRIDLFLLAGFHAPEAAIGHYGAALQLMLLGELVIMTLFNVLLPFASQLHTATEIAAFLRRFRRPAIVLFLAMLPVPLLALPLTPIVFGPEYKDTGRLFAVLFLGTAFAVGCAPAGAALYGLGRSRLVATLEGLRCFGVLLIGLAVVPSFGAYGMAWTVAVVRSTIGVLTFVLVHREVARLQAGDAAADDETIAHRTRGNT